MGSSAMTFEDEMARLKKELGSNPDSKDRYARAGIGGKEWFAFSAWIAEDRRRWLDEKVVLYRDSLVSWLALTDIAYVLQFESDPEIADYLKSILPEVASRETTEYRLARKREALTRGLGFYRKCLDDGSNSDMLSVQSGGGIGSMNNAMQRSVLRERVAYLTGESHGATHWNHPDNKLYENWYRREGRSAVPKLRNEVGP